MTVTWVSTQWPEAAAHRHSRVRRVRLAARCTHQTLRMIERDYDISLLSTLDDEVEPTSTTSKQ